MFFLLLTDTAIPNTNVISKTKFMDPSADAVTVLRLPVQ